MTKLRMKKVCFTFIILLACTVSFAQQIRIGLFTSQKLGVVRFSPKNGTYFIFSDTNLISKITITDVVELSSGTPGFNELVVNGNSFGSFTKLLFVSEKNENHLEIKVLKPNLKSRLYEGDFSVSNKNGFLELVNEIDLEQYLEGVVESESGTGQRIEYYKVQAIISRTYAIKYKNKHESAGFNLCDGTHCQAYLHKRNQSNLIDSAVKYTRKLVLVDSIGDLSSTFFHANCGGQTSEPDAVWNQKIVGFTSFKDTFCIHTQQANWIKKVPLKDWFSFLEDKYNFPSRDSLSHELALNFTQMERKAFYINPVYGIPLRDLREAFKLKSTYFNCRKEGDFIVLNGRGFGHGVGLCQEGAMNMAKKGYSYQQILAFYYPNRQLLQKPTYSFSLRK
jgi:stage II sporulation protein D